MNVYLEFGLAVFVRAWAIRFGQSHLGFFAALNVLGAFLSLATMRGDAQKTLTCELVSQFLVILLLQAIWRGTNLVRTHHGTLLWYF